jgi:hypothetical protein
VAEACRAADWDAHGAVPVASDAVRHARRFVEALPPGYPPPSVGAEPDGHVTLEWYRATDWLLSVSVSPEGMLYYAALLGKDDPRGSCPFGGEVPETILYLIRRVCAGDGFVEEPAPAPGAGTHDAENIFAEMAPLMVDPPDVDDSREAIPTRLDGE